MVAADRFVHHRAHVGQGVPAWHASRPGSTTSAIGPARTVPATTTVGCFGESGHRTNHLYSVAALTDSTGAVVERYKYDAYGQLTVLASDSVTVRSTSVYGNQVGFTGRYLDSETGLWYFRSRMYSGALGRFISRDAMEFIDGYSLYSAYFIPKFLDPNGNDLTQEYTQLEMDASGGKIPGVTPIADVTITLTEDKSKCSQPYSDRSANYCPIGSCTGNVDVTLTWTWTSLANDPANLQLPTATLQNTPTGQPSQPPQKGAFTPGPNKSDLNGSSETITISLGSVACSGGTISGTATVGGSANNGRQERKRWDIQYSVTIESCGVISSESINYVNNPGTDKLRQNQKPPLPPYAPPVLKK
jgi:RHS repeat-associated protein